jgi:hypothetical protein
MSKEIKYYVLGKFEGSFRTLQDLHLSAGEAFPFDKRHLIQIYRGIISDNQEISKDQFELQFGEITLNSINNIQINKGAQWPESNDRLFSLKQLKLSKIAITGLQSIKNNTYGNISGEISASVTEPAVVESEVEDDHSQKSLNPHQEFEEDKPVRFQDSGSNKKDQNNKEALENENSDNNSDKTSFKRKELDLQKEGWKFGIPPNIFKWLKRLFWILFLLGLFFSFTKYGKQLICSIQRYYYDNNRLSLEKEGKRLEGIIERTRPKKSECGSQIDFNGASLPQQYIYTLGTTSGDVEINYDMFTVPDRIEVSYNGKAVAQTKDVFLREEYKNWGNKGFADSSGRLVFHYNYQPNELHELTIRVIPNPDVSTTKWKFNVKCPQ